MYSNIINFALSLTIYRVHSVSDWGSAYITQHCFHFVLYRIGGFHCMLFASTAHSAQHPR